jgi:hypothetical protein
MNLGLIKSLRPKKMSQETYDSLLTRYEDDIKSLSEISGLNFNKWLEEKI